MLAMTLEGLKEEPDDMEPHYRMAPTRRIRKAPSAETIDALLETLREARRYAKTNPSESIRLVAMAFPGLKAALPLRLLVRVLKNLAAGVRFIRVDPDVLKGYITGAILEIQDWEHKNK